MVGYGPSLLLRVYFETADGGYYSPKFRDCFEALPIPEFIGRLQKLDVAKSFTYDKIPRRCSRGGLDKYLPTDYLLVGGSSYPVNKVIAHYDPRLDIGVYSDYWRAGGGRIPKVIKEFKGKSYLFLAAGLSEYPDRFFSKKHGFTEIRRVFMKSSRGIYVVGYMRIDEVVDLTEYTSNISQSLREGGIDEVWEKAINEYGKRVAMTPHYARTVDLPVVILSEKGNYDFFNKPLPLIEWVGRKRLLSKYSYLFNISGIDDRVRHKFFSEKETGKILEALGKEFSI